MDTATVNQLAAAIAAQLPSMSYAATALGFVITVIAAWLGAFYGEYFKTRGKASATRADFDELLDQLHRNTELVEKVRSEVGRRDWAAREWATLRRIKLEEVLLIANKCEFFVEAIENDALLGEPADVKEDPLAEFGAILALYFPEFDGIRGRYLIALRNRVHDSFTYRQQMFEAGQDAEALRNATNAFGQARGPHIRETHALQTELRAAAREAIRRIMPQTD